MNIVTGSGRTRSTFEFPCALFVNRSPKDQQDKARDMICRMLNIPTDDA